MFIRLSNLPKDITEDEVNRLFGKGEIVQQVIIQESVTDEGMAWVRVSENSRAVLNGIADKLSEKFIRNHQVQAVAPLFFNEPWIQPPKK